MSLSSWVLQVQDAVIRRGSARPRPRQMEKSEALTAEVEGAAAGLVEVHSMTPYMRIAIEATLEGAGTSRAVKGRAS